MNVFSRKRLNISDACSTVSFIALNMADAWLTGQLLVIGWAEINPIVITYGSNMLIKGLLSFMIALSLIRFGKANLLWILNICMVGIVLWLGAGLILSI